MPESSTIGASPTPRQQFLGRLRYHLITLLGFLVIDWAFDTPFSIVEALIFVGGMEAFKQLEHKLTGRPKE